MGSFARLNGGSADMADMMATTKEFAKQQGVIPAKVAGMLANNTENLHSSVKKVVRT